jgi:CRP-like cAMP-binding protein
LVEKEYAQGEVIVKQADPVDSIYFIVSGTADVRYNYIEDNQRKFKPLAKLTANQTIGLSETGLYSLSGVRTATVVAESDVVVLLRLSIAALNGFALANPHVGQLLHKNASMQDK